MSAIDAGRRDGQIPPSTALCFITCAGKDQERLQRFIAQEDAAADA